MSLRREAGERGVIERASADEIGEGVEQEPLYDETYLFLNGWFARSAGVPMMNR